MAEFEYPGRAYENLEFLNSPEARPIRVLSEFIEPRGRLRREHIHNTIVFFGSARTLPRDEAEKKLAEVKASGADADAIQSAEDMLEMSRYYEDARELASSLTLWSKENFTHDDGFYVCTGGGPGIMEAGNRGASEAGGVSVGLNINLPFEQDPNPYQTREVAFDFHYFFVRKFWFFYLAKAMVVFPGGFGTMDEVFELLTLVQTEKTKKPMPIVLYGKEFWDDIINFEGLVRRHVISPDDLDLFKICDSVEEAQEHLVAGIKRHYVDA